MACLNNKQIEYIRNDLKNRNISRSFLFDEWIDHVCCDVETLMGKGTGFEEAYRRVAGETSTEQVKSAHRTVQQFLNHRYVGIKKLLFLAFLVFACSWIVNVEGLGAWIGLVSFLVLVLVYLRVSLDFLRKRFVHRINILLSLLSFLSFLGILSGILLIFLSRKFGISTRGHGVDLTVFGWFFFSLLCLVYYLREYRASIDRKDLKKSGWFTTLAAFNVFLAALSIASFPLYRYVQAYLFFLIGFILGYNVLAILALLFTRSMKNTLILSLVIGSFMIVFIHSPFRSKLPGGKPKMHQLTLQYTPQQDSRQDGLYITMYYDRFPDKPITLPLRKTGEQTYSITMPSYAYQGYLFYKILPDSVDAGQFFSRAKEVDSVQLKIPNKKIYQLP